jgi:transcriptional regulator of acetoin/glycerol metabolism
MNSGSTLPVSSPPVLTDYELSSRREAMGDLIACSKLEMTTLYQQLADPELAVVLVDADGMIVHQVSVPFAEAVAADGLRVGALWSEREAGTNGMGTCLAERDCIASASTSISIRAIRRSPARPRPFSTIAARLPACWT